jgi:hypothetical protein
LEKISRSEGNRHNQWEIHENSSEPISQTFYIKVPTIWVGYLSTTNMPVEDCAKMYPYLGFTSSSRPASVVMFDVKLSCSKGGRLKILFGVASFTLSGLLLIVELLSPDQVGVWAYWF